MVSHTYPSLDPSPRLFCSRMHTVSISFLLSIQFRKGVWESLSFSHEDENTNENYEYTSSLNVLNVLMTSKHFTISSTVREYQYKGIG